tara:strand:+ start:18 stop:1232 length:1215 start_codon:yes stop_codon:yes gene_type:complete
MNTNPAPNFGLLASNIDFSSYNAKPFSRGATAVTDTWTSSYEDMISFLNGRGMASGKDLAANLLASSNFGTAWYIDIDENDKIEISSDVAFKIKYNSSTTLDNPSNVLGYGSGFTNSGGASSLGPKLANSIAATAEWERGMVKDFSYRIVQTSGGSAEFFFNFSGRAQDVVIAIRSRGNADIDDTASATLEGADVSANGGGDTRWMIDDSGYVVNTSIGLTAITWNANALELRNFLGFTGSESSTTENGYTILKATHPCTSVLVPSRPYQNNHLKVDNVSQSRRKIGGGYASNFIGSYISSELGFDLDARLDEIDLYRHFTDRFISYVSEGERINFYQVWGDSRRALITADVNNLQVAHNLIYTSSRNGYEGRIRGSMITKAFDLIYPTRLRRRVPVRVRIEHL